MAKTVKVTTQSTGKPTSNGGYRIDSTTRVGNQVVGKSTTTFKKGR